MISNFSDAALGQVMVATTDHGGHPPEFWATHTTNKIVSISENAPPHIRLQAEALRDHIYEVVLAGIQNAIVSAKTTQTAELTKQGYLDMAKIIKEL